MRSPNYSFTREPFSREIAPSQIFISQGHQELLARLRLAIEEGSLAVITGHVGSGKSTAIRAIINAMDVSRYRYIYLANSALTPAEFYRSLLHQVNVEPKRAMSENKRLVSQVMLEWHQKGIKPVVVIDEAQELAVPMLGELRFVLNYQADSFSPLTIILAGQPHLTETLKLQVLECIRQRITVHYRIPSLSEEEIPAYILHHLQVAGLGFRLNPNDSYCYILHHLQVAGLDRQVFTDEAIAMVSQFSKGIPRRINNLCRYALVAAVEADNPVVDAAAVQKGMDETNF
ncbi:MAG: ExeA family protein [Bacillota bacterium]